MDVRRPQSGDGEADHLGLFVSAGVVPAEHVQETMYGQEGQFGLLRVAVLGRLPNDRRPGDDDVAQMGARAAVAGRKGEHVGRPILPQELPVESPELTVSRDPNRELPTAFREPSSDLGHLACPREHGAKATGQDRGARGVVDDDHRRGDYVDHCGTASGYPDAVPQLILFLHARFALAEILFALLLAGWGSYQYIRHKAVSGGFRSAYLMLCGLTAVQGLLGVVNLLLGARLNNPLHLVYGVFAVLFLPGLYFYSVSGHQSKAREAVFLAVACWIVLIAFVRGWITGQ